MIDRIPKIFHFVFGLKKQIKPFHLVYYLCLKSCIEVNKPENINFYYHYEPFGKYWDLIKPHLTLVKVDLVDFFRNYEYPIKLTKKYNYAHQSDLIRLEKLKEYGGIYADIDTLFVNPIPDELYNKPFVLGEEGVIENEITKEMTPTLCNAFIMSKSDSKFLSIWLENLFSEFNGSWSNHSTILPYKLSQIHTKEIYVVPREYFYSYLWTKDDINLLFEGNDTSHENLYSIHLWSHLWWSKYRNDLTDFHEGKLTAEYIRNIDTTYNLFARKFLPDDNLKRSIRFNIIYFLIREKLFDFWEFLKNIKSKIFKAYYYYFDGKKNE